MKGASVPDARRSLGTAGDDMYSSQWGHRDVLDDKIVQFVDELGSGKVRFDTLLRMEMPGTFNIRPVDVQAAYSKKFRGYSEAANIEVLPKTEHQ